MIWPHQNQGNELSPLKRLQPAMSGDAFWLCKPTLQHPSPARKKEREEGGRGTWGQGRKEETAPKWRRIRIYRGHRVWLDVNIYLRGTYVFWTLECWLGVIFIQQTSRRACDGARFWGWKSKTRQSCCRQHCRHRRPAALGESRPRF